MTTLVVAVGAALAAVLALGIADVVARRAARLAEPAWGTPIERERDEVGLRKAFRWWSRGEEGVVGDRTWRDLALDVVFARIDRCLTSVGQVMLYRRLRMPAEDPVALETFERSVRAFEEDASTRLEFARAVLPLRTNALGLAALFYGEEPELPRGARLYPLATVATVGCALAAIIWPVMALACFGCLAVNIAVRLGLHRTMTLHTSTSAALAELVAAGRNVALLGDRTLGPEISAIKEALRAIEPYAMALRWNTIDPSRMNEILAVIVAYVNMTLLLDVHAFVRTIMLVRRARSALASLFERLGELDAARSVASFRAGTKRWCRPTFVPAGEPVRAEDLCHPLVEDAVENDFELFGLRPGPVARGLLVTGSNMSGKSTFLRAVATNAILAQSIGCATARSYCAPFLRIRTLIHVEDDLAKKQSHFLVEARAARDLLVETSEVDRLVVVDELFRGTNTIDRVAAGAAFLRALGRGGAFVIAATHDAELIDLLKEDYRPHYFTESVADGALTFDYRLRAGANAPRNAFAVLALVGFPADVLEDARLTRMPSYK